MSGGPIDHNRRYHGIIYRFRDADGQPLYIGMTSNPAHRFSGHGQTHRWQDVATIELEHHDNITWRELHRLEAAAITAEQPVWNRTNRVRPDYGPPPEDVAPVLTIADRLGFPGGALLNYVCTQKAIPSWKINERWHVSMADAQELVKSRCSRPTPGQSTDLDDVDGDAA